MSKQRLALFLVMLVAVGCQKPAARASFQKDSMVIPDWSVISFSDNHDYTIEIIRVETTGNTKVVATYDLTAMENGLGPKLLVQSKPQLRILGRGGEWFEYQIDEKRHGISGGWTSPSFLDSAQVVYYNYLLTDEDADPVFDDPELFPDEHDLGAGSAKALGIPMIVIRASVKNRS